MKLSLIGLALALAATAPALRAAGEGETLPQNDWMVHMDRSTGAWRFVPDSIVLVPGGLVQLMVFGEGQYSLTLDEPSGFDADISTTEGVIRTAEFHAPMDEGRYPFHDKYHPEARGVLVVRAAAAAAQGDGLVIGVVPGGYESRFAPSRLEVPAGAEVLFRANGTFGHNLQGVEANFSAGDLSPGQERAFTAPSEPGEYAFECRFHKEQGMIGVLVVKAAAAASPPPTGGNPSTDAGDEEESAVPSVGLVALVAVALVVAVGRRHLRK